MSSQVVNGIAKVETVTAPTVDERRRLASMRDELLEDDWAYWHNDAAILFLNRLLPESPPFVPEYMREAKP